MATTSTYLRDKVRKDKIEQLVNDYGKIKSTLEKHAPGFPTSEYLRGIVAERPL